MGGTSYSLEIIYKYIFIPGVNQGHHPSVHIEVQKALSAEIPAKFL